MYQKAISNLGIDKDVLPISCLNRDVVASAKEILLKIGNLVKQDLELCKLGFKVDLNKLLEIRTKI